MINNPNIYKFFKYFTNQRKKTNWAVVFSCKNFPNILKYRDRQKNLPTIWITRHLLKTLASGTSASQFFRTTTGIQSGTNAFDKPRFVMTFLTILRVTEILCSFRLVLEGKTGKEIPESSRLKFLENLSVNNFALLDAKDNNSRPLNRVWSSRFAFFENTTGNLPKVPRAKFQGSDGLFCFIGICNFGSFKNPFTIITDLSKLYFRFTRFILLVQMKKVISVNYGDCTSS